MHYAPPRLPNDLSPLPADPSVFIHAAREERCLSNILVENADLSGCDLSSLSVKQAKFIRCRFAGCDLTNLDGRDVVFSACDFSNARADRAYFSRCLFENSKAVGLHAQQTLWRQTAFLHGLFSYGNFEHAEWDGIRILNSDFSHAFFTFCTFKQVEWNDALLVGVCFSGSPLSGQDFSRSRLSAVTVSQYAPELSGAAVSPAQALEFSRLLGLIIKNPG